MSPRYFGDYAASLIKWMENTLQGRFNHGEVEACVAFDSLAGPGFVAQHGPCGRNCNHQAELARIMILRENLHSLSRQAENSLAANDQETNRLILQKLSTNVQAMLMTMNDMAKCCHVCPDSALPKPPKEVH